MSSNRQMRAFRSSAPSELAVDGARRARAAPNHALRSSRVPWLATKALEEKTTTVSSGYLFRFVASSQPILVRFRAFVRSPILLQWPIVRRGSGLRLRARLRFWLRLGARLRLWLRLTPALMLGERLLRAHDFLQGHRNNSHRRQHTVGSLAKSPLRRTWRAARLNAASCSASSPFSAVSMSARISARRKSSCAEATSRSDCRARVSISLTVAVSTSSQLFLNTWHMGLVKRCSCFSFRGRPAQSDCEGRARGSCLLLLACVLSPGLYDVVCTVRCNTTLRVLLQ